MPLSWSGRSIQTLSAAALSAVLLAGAAKHFSSPAVFGQLVPDAPCRDDSGERTNATLAVYSREEWVPLQLPLILWAWSLRGTKPAPGTGPGR